MIFITLIVIFTLAGYLIGYSKGLFYFEKDEKKAITSHNRMSNYGGYEWADKYTICDPEYDNGNSESFNEGVIAWGRDNCLANDD